MSNQEQHMKEEALRMHRENRGKVAVVSKVPVGNQWDLTLAYSPGVAEPCLKIHAARDDIYEYTNKGNMVAVVSNGTAVLGLGDIGAHAALPVMEGKSVLFKTFAGIDAFPICINTKDAEKVVETVKLIEPAFGGINLEDIGAPDCFEIEKRLKEELDIPVFHDDQHGTAVVVSAGLINALRIVGKSIENIKVTINGAGASAVAVALLLFRMGVKNIILCDSKGVIFEGRTEGMNPYKERLASLTNPEKVKGSLANAIKGADMFIGLSRARQVTPEMVRSMAGRPIIFALANPEPEIWPDEAYRAGAAVVATGRSDYPNQINNVLGFPGILRGALDVRARDINDEMKIAAACAIAELVGEEVSAEYIIPGPFDTRVAPAIAAAVAKAAMESGVARLTVDPVEVAERTRQVTAKLQQSPP